MKCSPYSLISACILLLCAAAIQSFQGYPDSVSVSFLMLGVTSVIHHSRLDDWWKYDVWRWFDYLAILIFTSLATYRFKFNTAWLLTCFIVFAITTAVWTDYVRSDIIPCLHAFMHILVASVVVTIILSENK